MAANQQQLRNEIRWLGTILGRVLRTQAGEHAFDLVEKVRALTKQRRRGDRQAERTLVRLLAGLDPEELSNVIHALSMFFDLANLAEDRHRVRVLQEREALPEPRRESIDQLIAHWKQTGLKAPSIQQVLDATTIELVFTAHPTEAKRRSIREKVRDLRTHLAHLDSAQLPKGEQDRLRRLIEADLVGLWQTDFVRFRRPTVLEELDRSLFFAGNLWKVAPRLYANLREALQTAYPRQTFAIPTLLRFGTWIGGDRDGNPNVTADITQRALQTLRRDAIHRHIHQAQLTRRQLSMSTRKVAVSKDLLRAIEQAQRDWPELTDHIAHLSEAEPYRRWLRVVQWRLQSAADADLLKPAPPGAYTDGAQLVRDLELVRDSLHEHRAALIADAHLEHWLMQARVFGLHMMRLDIRQDSSWYHDVLAELLAQLGLCDDYAHLDEKGRQHVLTRPLPKRRTVKTETLSERAQETVALFRLLANVAAVSGPLGLGAHIISMTHEASDLLAVLWLSRWAAAERHLPDERLPMPIAPLFETIDDLQRASDVMSTALQQPAYRAHVDALGGTQIIMIGYSDSTKDGGYLTACWGLQDAQRRIHESVTACGVRVVYFHGRGGSLGRGGGPAARSILSLPPRTVEAGLRITEQGEVLAERYDDPAIAHRHLEQVVSATLLQSSRAVELHRTQQRFTTNDSEREDVVAELSRHARQVYRQLVDQPGFITYFEQATPISQIEKLPIGSRPARRSDERSLNTLRAIPWVFSWTQCRHLLPAWYGLGSAINAYVQAHRSHRDTLRTLYTESSFFRATIDNAALALAKSDMGIAHQHSTLVTDRGIRKRIWSLIEAEYERSCDGVLSIIGRRALLADVPWLKRSIEVRNPYVDGLNFVQIELFRRLADLLRDDKQRDRLAELIRLTIQGIAGGLRTTG